MIELGLFLLIFIVLKSPKGPWCMKYGWMCVCQLSIHIFHI